MTTRGQTSRSLIALSICMAGCLKVNPQADYERTRSLLTERTSSADVYDPDLDAEIDSRIQAILTRGLSAEGAVRVALLQNKGFQALFSRIGASRADVVQSQLLSNPSISFASRFPEGGGRTNLTLTFAQELVDLWQIPVKRKIAEAQLEEMVADVVRQGIELTADVQRRWYELSALHRAVAITDENLSIVKSSISIAEARLRAGEAGQIDVNLLRATELDVLTTLLGLTRDEDVARANLARALGVSRWKTDWTIADDGEVPSF
ncbi:MAG TPA: TolC family protein, partial [Phycisphaerae bacterium]|nr:TolC family protein [Phycisphaerae bacterium]